MRQDGFRHIGRRRVISFRDILIHQETRSRPEDVAMELATESAALWELMMSSIHASIKSCSCWIYCRRRAAKISRCIALPHADPQSNEIRAVCARDRTEMIRFVMSCRQRTSLLLYKSADSWDKSDLIPGIVSKIVDEASLALFSRNLYSWNI